jgi:Ca2+-binding EF-hand superfamily protein
MAAEKATKVKDAFRRYDKRGLGFIEQQDLTAILGKIGIRADYDWILDSVLKDSDGSVSYVDFVDKVFEIQDTALAMVSKHAATVGDEVAVLLPSRSGVVTAKTTTDVQLRLPDGNELWFDIEDVEGGPVILHECKPGSKITLQDGQRCVVTRRNTADLEVQLSDGSKVWRGIEDCRQEEAQAHLSVGSKANIIVPVRRARVVERTTTDALVRLPQGVEVWVEVEQLAPAATAPSAESVARLKEIFGRCDSSQDGVISKRELIKICRSDKNIADFFGLPTQIRQEDGSRDQMESKFQAIDLDGDRSLSWQEFRGFFLDCKMGSLGAAQRALTGEQRAITM